MDGVIQPEGWPAPRGFANGVVASGRLLAVAGQIGTGRDGRLVSPDFVAQFDQALANVLEVVRSAGGGAEHLLSMTVYVVDRLQYLASRSEVGAAWRARVGRHFPAMTLIEVRALLDEDARVELQALAVLP